MTKGPVPTGDWQFASSPRAIALGDSIPKNACDRTGSRAEYGDLSFSSNVEGSTAREDS
jgi:hypothetical protein